MADAAPVVHIGENSPEEVAFKLMKIIGECENKSLHFHSSHGGADRKYVLKLYQQCLETVSGKTMDWGRLLDD